LLILATPIGHAGRLDLCGTGLAVADRREQLPPIMLWAWERPEDLRYIDPHQAGIAYLAKTLLLRNNTVVVRPRRQPLKFPEDALLIAVVRIESDRRDPPGLSVEQRAQSVSEIVRLARGNSVAAVQIDFDAKQSERGFYHDLITELRPQLPDGVGLSITALASWCISDDWIRDLPVDEAVPMLFRMGKDRDKVHRHLQAGGDFGPELCRRSFGISTDEPLEALPEGRRVYIFNPHSWTREAARKITGRVAPDAIRHH
jgi:hypothetical protein